MATSKSHKTEASNSKSGDGVAILEHPRAARMKRLGTYALQSPGRHNVTQRDVAIASEHARKIMDEERGIEEEEAVLAPTEPRLTRKSGMTDTVTGDALRQEEEKSKSQQRREKAIADAKKKSSGNGPKSGKSDKTVPAPQVEGGTNSSEKKESSPVPTNSKK